MKHISVKHALQRLRDHIEPLASELVPLTHAYGRTLRKDIFCDRDLPPYDRVMMDGIAINRSEGKTQTRWQLCGEQAAGQAPLALRSPQEAVEVMTGASLPHNADTVIPYELISKQKSHVSLLPEAEAQTGQYIHCQGSDAGKGDILLKAPIRLGSKEIAACASVGAAEVHVSRKPNIACITTGGELVDPIQTPGKTQIRRSNDQSISGVLQSHGIDLNTQTSVNDDASAIEQKLCELKEDHDVIVLSGGVSRGKYDVVPHCVEKAGYRILFHRIQQKPGGPMLAAISDAGKLLFGLPGNPLSCLVCAHVYLEDALLRMTDATPVPKYVTLNALPTLLPHKAQFIPVRIQETHEGLLNAEILPPNTSGDFCTILHTDGFVYLPLTVSDATLLEPDTRYRFYPWR